MTYLLQPYPDNMKKMTAEKRDQLRTEYYHHLNSVNNDLHKLLDLITFTCEDYVISTQSSYASCTRDFPTYHYSIGGKCFASHGPFSGHGKAINLDFRSKTSRINKIDLNIASDDAAFYSNMFVHVYDETMNMYALAYKELTPLKINGYTIVLVEKQTIERTNQHRAIEDYQCNNDPAYRHEDCVR